jgi:hypothetical protein
MKKPNLYSLVFCSLTLTWGLAGPALADPVSATAPAAVAAPSGDFALNITPEALSTTHKVVKINLARWLNGARLLEPQPNGDLKTVVYDEYESAQNALLSKNPNTPPALGALMDDDATAQVPLKQGDTSVIVDCGIARTIERFGFFSFSAAGSVDIYYSDTSPQSAKPDDKIWKSANIHQAFGSRRIVNVDLKGMDSRFVMIVYKLNAPGNIGPIALFGSIDLKNPIAAPNQEDKDGKVKVVPPEDLVEFDYAQSAYGSKVSHVVGGDVDEAQNVLNSDPTKSLTLGAVGATSQNQDVKSENIFIVDMGEKRDINKVGLLFSTSGNGSFEFYFLDNLPTRPKSAKTAFNDYLRRPQPILLASNDNRFAEAILLAQDTTGVTQLDYLPADFFSSNKPGFTQAIQGDNNNGRIAGTFDNTEKFRYALIRWVPQTPNQPPIEVFRVNLIGKVPMEDFGTSSKSMVNALDPTGKLDPAVTPSTPPTVGLTTPTPPSGPSTPPTNQPPTNEPPPNPNPTPNNNPPVSS